MATGFVIRAIEPAEFPAFVAIGVDAFHSAQAVETYVEHERTTFEFDRSVAAFDGDRMVGSACTFSFGLSVPGGSVAAGGISMIAVHQRYRRRGLLTSMMGNLLADSVQRGEPAAALFAAEPEIYGRYGFGCASEDVRVTIPRSEGRIIPPPFPGQDDSVRLRDADPAASHDDLALVYEALAAVRPGMTSRDKRWWQSRTADPEWGRGGRGPLHCLVAEDDAGLCGYALYSVRAVAGDPGIPAAKLRVQELVAVRPGAAATLWSDLLATDLVDEVSAHSLPVDDPLLRLLSGQRRARPAIVDALWIRLIDLPTALSRRRYTREIDVVLEVTDAQLQANAGRWRLQADQAGQATCTRTDRTADLLAPVQALGAAYLGGTSLGSLAAAGQVSEVRPGTVASLSAAMSWHLAPWCPMVF
ncbi:MAG TPA: GNAT family N-acetyltransferase [Streptosporangiaceae bacterium]|jgi:predicted acetyltransferase